MPGCEVLNASATCSSTATCSGASPVPRQQYQRISTSPGLAAEPVPGMAVIPGVGSPDAAPSDAAGAADSEDAGAATEADGLVLLLLQAAATRMTTAMRAPRRLSSLSISLLLVLAMGRGAARDLIDVLLLFVALGSRPARPDDDALHVIARPIAADECPPQFDRHAFDGRRDTLDEQRGGSRRTLEQARLAGAQQDGLDRLAGPGDADAVALGQQVVQRAALEIRGEEAREPLGRQVDLFEQERFAVGEAQALEVERRRSQ